MRRLNTAFGIGLLLPLAALSCVSPPLESPTLVPTLETKIRVRQNVRNKVDVLFVVDNSLSMQPMSEELKNKFGQFFKVFDDLAHPLDPVANPPQFADMHIGVITTDYGAGAGGSTCTNSPGGEFGQLQKVGKAAPPTCRAPQGSSFISYEFTADQSNPNNLPTGQNLVETFTCMASVINQNTSGCGFEHVLESAYAALHNNLPENAGFLRDDALLAVVFLTNEDDCSAPPDSDLFDKVKTVQYGYFSSFRCTRFGLVYGDDPGQLPPYANSGGVLSNVRSAPTPPGKLYDISRYINFFTKPAIQGGVKIDPLDVILVGIDAPSDPVKVILSDPSTTGRYTECGQLNEGTNPACVPVLDRSCQSPTNPNFYGDPAVRVNTVIRSAPNSAIKSICDTDYTGAMQTVAALILSNIGNGCIPAKLPDVNNPDCVVEDVTRNLDGTTTVAPIRRCDTAPGTYPCWRVESKSECAGTGEGLGVTIDRNNMTPPLNTNASVACATLAGA